jgi:hypothetical protein
MQVLVSDRGSGKTTRLLDWLAQGQEIPGYPGWSRVLLVHSIDEVLRLRDIIRADPEHPLIEDDPHRIYHLEDWQHAHASYPVEVALDNAEMHLTRLLGRGGGRLATVAMTGEPWS